MRLASRSLVGWVMAGALVIAACGSDDSASIPVTVITQPDTADLFGWRPFGEDERVEIGSLRVPIDADDPSAGEFDLYVARHRADPDRRIGSLLVNPGGPGVGGADYAIYAAQVVSPTLLAHFDIIGWDPRGTGLSQPAIDCVDDYDRYYAGIDVTPDDDAERTVAFDRAAEFQQGCVERAGELLAFTGTNDSARDIDRIRQALGEDEISYLGFSYGSELGGVWATMFPTTVRAAVLDGAVDPTASSIESSRQQSVGFEAALATFLADCSSDDNCAFHNDGNAESAFDALMARLDEQPMPTNEGRPLADRGVAVTAVVTALYSQERWPELAQALADAADGDGSGLLALHDSYYGRRDDGSWDNTLEAFQVISCIDTPERLSVAEEQAALDSIRAEAPRVVPYTVAVPACELIPVADAPRIAITGAGAGPIVVVGTTGDPSTPLAGTRRMAEVLEDGILVTVVAEQHTGYGVNDCVTETVDAYLVALTRPAAGLLCE
jgi:pimeloyl-ACP methyl ester carboxylesterase